MSHNVYFMFIVDSKQEFQACLYNPVEAKIIYNLK